MTPHHVHAHHIPPAEPIPHIDTARLPFDGADELRQRWRALMGPLGFSESLLWFVFVLDDREFMQTINQIPLPTTPNVHLIDGLMAEFARATEQFTRVSVACLYTRPGSDGITARDRGWAQVITDGAARHRVPIHPLFRANDLALVPLGPDSGIESSGPFEQAS
ncbi:hypothetical protein [Gordonia sp. NPDC003376]